MNKLTSMMMVKVFKMLGVLQCHRCDGQEYLSSG